MRAGCWLPASSGSHFLHAFTEQRSRAALLLQYAVRGELYLRGAEMKKAGTSLPPAGWLHAGIQSLADSSLLLLQEGTSSSQMV